MRVLRRFPVSDEKMTYRCTKLDPNEIFEISNNGFCISGHVTPELARRHENVGNHIAHRMEALLDSCGTSFRSKLPLKSRNLGFGRDGTFFQSFRKF